MAETPRRLGNRIEPPPHVGQRRRVDKQQCRAHRGQILPDCPERSVSRNFVIGFHRVRRFGLRERARRAHAREHAIAGRRLGRHLREGCLGLGSLAFFVQGDRRLKFRARGSSLLRNPIFVSAPASHAGDDQDSEGDQIDAVAIPQLFELLAPDFLVHFMKNIGHDGSQPPSPPPGPNCAVT